MDPVRNRAHRPVCVVEAGPDRGPHVARDLTVELADAVDEVGGPEGERGHVEKRPAAVVVMAERQERFAIRAERAPGAREVCFDEAEGERVVACRDGRVRRENRRGPDRLERRLERRAVLDQITDALQHDKRRVSFIEVPGRWLNPHRFEGANAANAEDDLLLNARLAIAAVEARRQFAVPRRVLLEIGVEEKQPHAAEQNLPHRHEHRAIPERHGDDARTAVGADGRFNRRVGPVHANVDFLLPPFRRHRLVEVALRIHEADADERNPEVARFLAVIAGEHTEAAGVNRQRLVEREFGREVGNRAGRAMVTMPPRIEGRARCVERHDGGVVELEEPFVLCSLLEELGRDEPEHEDRVVRGLPPKRVVQFAKDFPGFGVPGPP